MYNPFWNKTITIFTPLSSETNVKWYKYIFKNVFFKIRGYKTDGSNYSENKSSIIRIQNTSFLDYEEWINSDKDIYFSVNNESILIPRYVEDIISDNTSGTELFDKYQCVKPTSITNNLYAYCPHVLIVGD